MEKKACHSLNDHRYVILRAILESVWIGRGLVAAKGVKLRASKLSYYYLILLCLGKRDVARSRTSAELHLGYLSALSIIHYRLHQGHLTPLSIIHYQFLPLAGTASQTLHLLPAAQVKVGNVSLDRCQGKNTQATIFQLPAVPSP